VGRLLIAAVIPNVFPAAAAAPKRLNLCGAHATVMEDTAGCGTKASRKSTAESYYYGRPVGSLVYGASDCRIKAKMANVGYQMDERKATDVKSSALLLR